MAFKRTTVHFNCPNRNALYHIVKTEAGPETDDREITCRACGEPLPARDGTRIANMFLLRKVGRPIDERVKARDGKVRPA